MSKKLIYISLIILIAGLISSCSDLDAGSGGYYLVDPRFNDLYERLQGEEVLGPPISSKKYLSGSNLEKQYFEGVVMVFDPDNSPRYYLEPVGIDAGFSDLPNNTPENPGVRYLNGYIIPADFAQFYDQMGGARWVGLPLTRARLNPEKNRIEQYFENMGFFRFEDDPPGEVYLMPYGLWKCAGECSQYPGVQNASISKTDPQTVESPFGEAIARLGTQFTGKKITDAYLAEDGRVEQIFQNIVLFQDPSSPLGISLRPLSALLGQAEGEYQHRANLAEGYFRELADGAGYYIPGYFLEYIDRYFGFEVSGEPISPLQEIREGVALQCFENYCLLYDAKANSDQQVRIQPQGQKYKEAFYLNLQGPAPKPAIIKQIQLDIWEQLPQITSLENQQIGACIHEDGQPIANARAVVQVVIQESGTREYTFQPTDAGGCSFLTLDPIQAPNGTTIDYQVCFEGLGNDGYCKKDSFLIWGNTENALTSTPIVFQPENEQGESDLVIDVWELKSQVSSSEYQEVGACVHLHGEPQSNLETQLLLEAPNQGVITYPGNSTDAGGCAFFRIDPVDAKNGESIAYQVCFINKYGEKICKQDSFLIWGNP
jgi:hypothetical protein